MQMSTQEMLEEHAERVLDASRWAGERFNALACCVVVRQRSCDTIEQMRAGHRLDKS